MPRSPWMWAMRTRSRPTPRSVHKLMLGYGIANSFELYHGNHTNRVAFRVQDHVLPFFGKNLSFEGASPPTSPPVAGDMGSGAHPAIMEVDPRCPATSSDRLGIWPASGGRSCRSTSGAMAPAATTARACPIICWRSPRWLSGDRPGYVDEELKRVQMGCPRKDGDRWRCDIGGRSTQWPRLGDRAE